MYFNRCRSLYEIRTIYATERCDADTVVKCIEKILLYLWCNGKFFSNIGKCFIANSFKTFCETFSIVILIYVVI